MVFKPTSWIARLLSASGSRPANSDHPAMQAYLASAAVDKNLALNDCSMLVADLEMTGLNAGSDQIVSIGWVVIERLQIVHASARHIYFNNTDVNLDQSAPIHKISHRQLASGVDQEVAVNEFLEALAGKALVLHHAPLDMSFLNVLSKRLYGVVPKPRIVDTMAIERRRLTLNGTLMTSSLRLNDCRRRYNLPQYQAHNAAIDALATAELLLAQVAYDGQKGRSKLADYLS